MPEAVKSQFIAKYRLRNGKGQFRVWDHGIAARQDDAAVDLDFECGSYLSTARTCISIPMSLLELRQLGDAIQNAVAEISGDNDRPAVPVKEREERAKV